MTFDWTLKLGDIAIVVATFLGPVAAVQAQKWVERGQQQRQRRITVFRTLMATRRQALSPAHVEAINVIPVEFYGKQGKRLEIIELWKKYIDHLYRDPSDPAWGNERVNLLNDLIDRIGKYLGYRFNSVEISREVYSPKGHATIESDQEIIRQGLAKVFRGEMAIPMAVTSFPIDPKMAEGQLDLQSKLREWLADGR
jgi:hypothetical protein